MSEILNINEGVRFSTAIRREELHTYDPYTPTQYENNDEIRIPIHYQDIYTVPHDSYIVIEGKFLKSDGKTPIKAKLANNGFAHLFDEIRYELFGMEIDKVKNVGICSTMKTYVSMNSN